VAADPLLVLIDSVANHGTFPHVPPRESGLPLVALVPQAAQDSIGTSRSAVTGASRTWPSSSCGPAGRRSTSVLGTRGG
jgi:hypothetical protein